MPRIPFAQTPDMPRHTSDAVPMSGAPGMGFKMEEGEALKQFGRSIGEAGRAVGSAMADFNNKMTDTRNSLAAAEAQSLYQKKYAELKTRMANNPGEFAKFGEWAQELEDAYSEEAKPILERMSRNYRKLFETRMAGVRAERQGTVDYFRSQAEVSENLRIYDALKKEYSQNGDAEAYKAIVQEHRGRLISDAQADLDLRDYPRLAESSEARQLIDSDPESALKKLSERGGPDATYTQYTHLPPDYRRSLIRSAEVAAARKQNDFCQNLISHYYSTGQLLHSDEELKQMHEEGRLSDELYNRAVNYNKHFLAEMSAKESRAASARNAGIDKRIAEFTLKNLYDERGRQRILTEGEADLVCQRALQLCEAYPAKGLALVKTIRASVEKIKRGDVFDTPDGKEVLKFLRAQDFYYNAGPLKRGWFGGEKREPIDLNSKDFQKNIDGTRGDGFDFTDAYAAQQRLDLYRLGEEMLAQGKSAPEIIERMTGAVDSIHAGRTQNVLEYFQIDNQHRKLVSQFNGQSATGPVSRGIFATGAPAAVMSGILPPSETHQKQQPREGDTGTTQEGRKVIYRNGAWHYVQQ